MKIINARNMKKRKRKTEINTQTGRKKLYIRKYLMKSKRHIWN